MTTQLTESVGLDHWSEPERFMDREADADGLNPIHLNCLNHCLREVLHGHGIVRPLRLIARPLGLVLVVDKTLRIWLMSQAEQEWDDPRYNAGLTARWLPVRGETDFRRTLSSIVDSGRVGIARATRWRVPWLSQTALAPSDWHASVFCELNGDRIRVVDRQFAGTTTAARDLRVEFAELRPTIEGGMALLDYRLGPDPETDEQLVRRLIEESAANLRTAPAFPGAGKAFGIDALDQLEALLSGDCFPEIDSRHLRVTLRWHLPSCIRKFVVGNRTVLGLLIRRFSERRESYVDLLARLESDCAAWDSFARAIALAARAADRGIGEELFAALGRVRHEERRLMEELCRESRVSRDPSPLHPLRPTAVPVCVTALSENPNTTRYEGSPPPCQGPRGSTAESKGPESRDTSLLRAIDIKGRATESDLAAALGTDPAGLAGQCRAQLDAGRLERGAAGLRLSDSGRALLAELLHAERATLDQVTISVLYERFHALDRELKDIIRAWQVRAGDTPNDHTDATYDTVVLGRLFSLHHKAADLLDELVTLVPRLAVHRRRLDAAVDRVTGGERSYISGALVDSYHTVWFELHEDLLGITGRSRAAEEGASG